MWEPVNFEGGEPAKAGDVASGRTPKGLGPVAAQEAVPKGSELDSWSQQTYNLSRSAAINLGFSLGSVNAKGEQRVFVAEASRYKEVPSADGGTRLRYGAALRLIVEATETSGDASLSLPVLAAKVAVNQAQTSTSLVLRGYKGQVKLPDFKVLSVETYADWVQAISDMEKVFNDDADNIVPVLLAKLPPEPEPDLLDSAIGEVWALAEIAQGQPLREALARYPDTTTNDSAVEAITETYGMLVEGGDDTVPTEDTRAAAHRRLHGLRVRT